jgi:hypothetical protein
MTNKEHSKVSQCSTSESNIFISNLSQHILTEPESTVLKKGLNFGISVPHSNLDMACATEYVASRLSPSLGSEFRWRIRSMLEKARPVTSNMTKTEFKALKSLKHNFLGPVKKNCKKMGR